MRARSFLDFFAFAARCAVVGLAAAFVLNSVAPSLVDRLRGAPSSSASVSIGSRSGPFSYADAVGRASPAVVNIYANRTTLQRQMVPLSPLTQRLLGMRGGVAFGPLEKRLERSLGSGVIFSSSGYVLTNNHVINGADDIQILLDDGRVSKAQVVGTDAETDLAVLKIDAGNLPEIAVSADSAADVGDVVLAIGNPVGLGKTVTMGIVSATGRQLRMSAYEDFIQTDAAINAGNSGGALVNAAGELIGINTAVFPRAPTRDGRGSYTPGAEGIGFAIPVATAKAVLDQIIEHGHVVRGWIGIDYVDVPPPSGSTARPSGVMVARVVPESPAAQAGLQPYDVLLKFDGVDIVDQGDLRNREAMLAPGTKVRLEGLRSNAPFSVDAVLTQRPPPGTIGT